MAKEIKFAEDTRKALEAGVNKLADTVICLPLHAELSEADVERILNLIKKK